MGSVPLHRRLQCIKSRLRKVVKSICLWDQTPKDFYELDLLVKSTCISLVSVSSRLIVGIIPRQLYTTCENYACEAKSVSDLFGVVLTRSSGYNKSFNTDIPSVDHSFYVSSIQSIVQLRRFAVICFTFLVAISKQSEWRLFTGFPVMFARDACLMLSFQLCNLGDYGFFPILERK